MKLPWFRRTGIFYIPSALCGWLILLAGLAFSVSTFIRIDSKSHSVSDTLRPYLIYLIIIWADYSFIAYLTAGKAKNE
jgi:hypothetical protein